MAMTPDDFRATLDSLGMTQGGAARFLGVDPRNIRRWAAGDARIPDSAEMLLRIVVTRGWKPKRIRSLYCKGCADG